MWQGAAPLARLGGRLADFLFPPLCPACNRPVAGQGQFCPDCFRRLHLITAPYCLRCGAPFVHAAQGSAAGLCRRCATNPPAFQAARAAFRYDQTSRGLILPLKYASRIDLAPLLARHMARAGADLLATADLLVPVPLHRLRLLRRGYNQALLLARALARLTALPVLPNALTRRRATPLLGERPPEERAALLAQAGIAVRRRHLPHIAGRRILLIDDVLTSGATAETCARALNAAGASWIGVLAAARASNPYSA